MFLILPKLTYRHNIHNNNNINISNINTYDNVYGAGAVIMTKLFWDFTRCSDEHRTASNGWRTSHQFKFNWWSTSLPVDCRHQVCHGSSPPGLYLSISVRTAPPVSVRVRVSFSFSVTLLRIRCHLHPRSLLLSRNADTHFYFYFLSHSWMAYRTLSPTVSIIVYYTRPMWTSIYNRNSYSASVSYSCSHKTYIIKLTKNTNLRI